MSKEKMIPLPTQELFESFYKTVSRPTLIYFTASWCGPCKRLDWDVLFDHLKTTEVYKCDVSENTYTPGFCGVKSIPAFMMLRPGQAPASFQSSDTALVAEWLLKQSLPNE